jgi:uncharacterized membrane protein
LAQFDASDIFPAEFDPAPHRYRKPLQAIKEGNMMVLQYISQGIGIAAIAVIVWRVLLTFGKVVLLEFARLKRRNILREREGLRHQFGSYLLLGLEFLIAADIIYTVTHPRLEEVALLGSIVVIRTVISYFLDREIAGFHAHAGEETPG